MPSETKRKNCWGKYAAGGASAIRNTVVSAGFQPLWGVKTGTLPRNRLAFSATGGASAIRNTVVSAGFQPLWGVKTGTLPRNRLAFSTTGGANFHGVHEFVPMASMEKMVQVLVELVRC